MTLPKALEDGRAKSRVELRKTLDQMRRITDTAAEDPAIAFDEYYAKAFDLVTSDGAQKAFDISHEPEDVRAKYGRNDFGQRLLLARRLTEVGVPFVTVYSGGWDDHRGLFTNYKKNKAENLDTGVSALIQDLADRGTLDNTMVILLGEFGRTPKINKDAGRDHWSFAMSVLMAGAGIPGGQIVGATDVKGSTRPKTSRRASTPRWVSIRRRSSTTRTTAPSSSSTTVVSSRSSSPDPRDAPARTRHRAGSRGL